MRDQSRLAAAASRSHSTSMLHSPYSPMTNYDHPPDAIMIEHDLLHWAWGDRDRRAGLRVIPLVQLPCVCPLGKTHNPVPWRHPSLNHGQDTRANRTGHTVEGADRCGGLAPHPWAFFECERGHILNV